MKTNEYLKDLLKKMDDSSTYKEFLEYEKKYDDYTLLAEKQRIREEKLKRLGIK